MQSNALNGRKDEEEEEEEEGDWCFSVQTLSASHSDLRRQDGYEIPGRP